ncbi:MAG: uroporphyrinogen-III C-methyltransferase [Candidatus Protistobacter heckmanni]|nr:uroporphyrinogen-III C-methyltransferase [Candidatus Protistobacter heckmanni]
MGSKPASNQASRKGKVYLIGAGPGAADLITVRGARILETAGIVLHDALVQPDMLAYCPRARKVEVGKRCGRFSTAQAFINKQLVDAAAKYEVVVRLKGGDPMLFGRADEEMRALEEAGIDYEIVPGITAALAAAAAVRSPLTKRGVARSVTLMTQAKAAGTEDASLSDSDSLVIYMGRDQAERLAAKLIAQGRSPATPAWIAESVSTPAQRWLHLTLKEMAEGVARSWLDAAQPSLLMIGDAFAARASAAQPAEAQEAAPQPGASRAA